VKTFPETGATLTNHDVPIFSSKVKQRSGGELGNTSALGWHVEIESLHNVDADQSARSARFVVHAAHVATSICRALIAATAAAAAAQEELIAVRHCMHRPTTCDAHGVRNNNVEHTARM